MNKFEREVLKKHYKKLGRKGGSSTVDKYGRLKMQEWGKLGGRPKRAKLKGKIKTVILDKPSK